MNQSSDAGKDNPHTRSITLDIYRELRVGMVVVMVMLFLAMLVERMLATRWQSALSEYYYTSAHSIFVGALLTLATLVLVYKGSSDTEDALLTLAGICALTIALVPQVRPQLYGRPGIDLPPQYNVESIIQPNMWAVVVALVLGWSLTFWQRRSHPSEQSRTTGGTLALYFLRLVLTLGLIALIFFRNGFNKYAHGIAGTLMILAFIATVSCAAYLVRRQEESPHRNSYKWWYRVIAVAMLVTLVTVLTLHLVRPHWMGDLWIIVFETGLIVEFVAFWVVQTIELWDTPDRMELLPEPTRDRLTKGRTKGGLAGLKSDLAEARQEPWGEKLLPLL